MALKGIEKATILLSILGADASVKILQYLPDDMADLLASGVNNLPKASPEAVSAVITELRGFMSLPPAMRPAAIEGARSEASGREAKSKASSPSEIISSVPGRVLIPILLRERPQTIAFVLNELPDPRVSEVLTYLPEQRREVEYLLNTIKENPLMDKIKGGVLEYVARKLS